METVGRWWNGIWGRLARRDIWLARDTRWHVVARQGDQETGKVLRWEYGDEAEARAMVRRLMGAHGPGEWRDQVPTTPPTQGRRSPPV